MGLVTFQVVKTIGKALVLIVWSGHISYTICFSGNLPKDRRVLEGDKGKSVLSDEEYAELRERMRVQTKRDKWDLVYGSGLYTLLLYLLS